MREHALISLLLASTALALACGDSEEPPPAGNIPPPVDTASLDRLTARNGCPAAAGTGTDVAGDITQDTTWTAAGSPYRLENSIRVSAELRLEACVVVQLAKNARLQVGNNPSPGKLIATGEAERDASGTELLRPVIFEAKDAAQPWGSLVVDTTGTVDAYFLILLDGANPESDQNGGGSILAYGVTEEPPVVTKSVGLRYVVIARSGGHGVNLTRRSAFTDASEKLVVMDSGRESTPYPIALEPGAIGSVPKDSIFTGNVRNEIVVNGSIPLGVDDVLRKRSVPYRITGAFYLTPVVDGPMVTLTIEPGVILRFEETAGSGLVIGSSESRLGRLVAAGTTQQPILFTSAKDAPAPADWMGIYFRYSPSSGNRIENAIIEYAGAFSGAQGYGCGPAENDASVLILSGRPETAFVSNTTFRNAGGDTQIVLGWTSDQDGPDFVSTNTFAESPSCRVGRWRRETAPACPEPPASGCL